MELRDQSSAELENIRPEEVSLPADDAPAVTDSVVESDVNEVCVNDTMPVENAGGESVSEDEAPASVSEPVVDRPMSKEEVIARLEEISSRSGSDVSRDEVTRLRQAFHAFRKNELIAEKEAFIADGNDEKDYLPSLDPLEERMTVLLNMIKEAKAEFIARQDEERRANLARKRDIIKELDEMAADTDNVNRHFPRFRELTQAFKDAGEVPPTDATDLWRDYQAAVERFYDQLKVNKDLRDYDFRKNLEMKQLLIEEAEKLEGEADVVTAFRRLQDLHEKWRDVGPVAKELRDEIWNRFKEASAVINKKYQAFFEERKERERENEEKKTAICERVEKIDITALANHSAWEQATKEILAAQEEWKKLGFASKKVNNALFARFRKTCDDFFTAKGDYFRQVRDMRTSNLERKTALCERAEALKDSTDWKKTADAIAELQKEWKTIGPVDKKHSDIIWRRFIDACDYFFECRKKATSGQRRTERENLKSKEEIIKSLKAIADDTPRDEAIAKVKELQSAWQAVGHVPFRDKDRVNEEYRAIVGNLYEHFDIREKRARMEAFAGNIREMQGDGNRLGRERERLVRALEQKRGEIKTYENNLGFFNVTSKSGNALLRDMERKIDHLKEDLKALEEKIRLIDQNI
ncbi:DUF349 domain-containing protein [Muribaculum sp.]|uniref:DUF349 domain-containing protein n=1 Tax=Muribaculum sp. TaxID=1918611 RepID=UPI0023CCE9C9|nr:DUF349 domain-containing protein [Muribaculum sp.]MDE5704465.1 DUF349 domain-containing protein [Muribaculum sp.]